MQNGKIKVKDVYRKEVLLAIFLFVLPFLPTLHLFVGETYLPVITFFGLTFNGEGITYQVFVWEFLRRLVFAIYSLLFYYSSKTKFKPLIFVL
ncbi:MAG: hypothetical protein AAGH81_18735, partial [Bacteroidota bacterium]